MWKSWTKQRKFDSINSQVGNNVNVSKPQTTISALSLPPAKSLKKEASPALPAKSLKKKASPEKNEQDGVAQKSTNSVADEEESADSTIDN